MHYIPPVFYLKCLQPHYISTIANIIEFPKNQCWMFPLIRLYFDYLAIVPGAVQSFAPNNCY
jgi:hypothetical protein